MSSLLEIQFLTSILPVTVAEIKAVRRYCINLILNSLIALILFYLFIRNWK